METNKENKKQPEEEIITTKKDIFFAWSFVALIFIALFFVTYIILSNDEVKFETDAKIIVINPMGCDEGCCEYSNWTYEAEYRWRECVDPDPGYQIKEVKDLTLEWLDKYCECFYACKTETVCKECETYICGGDIVEVIR